MPNLWAPPRVHEKIRHVSYLFQGIGPEGRVAWGGKGKLVKEGYMGHTDPLADFLTRIRNASRAGLVTVNAPYSKLKEAVASVLVREGFLSEVVVVGKDSSRELKVGIRYSADGQPVLGDLQRVSKPGRRSYRGVDDIEQVRSGMGIAIFSTPKGVMTDKSAREHRVGGEILCEVW